MANLSTAGVSIEKEGKLGRLITLSLHHDIGPLVRIIQLNGGLNCGPKDVVLTGHM